MTKIDTTCRVSADTTNPVEEASTRNALATVVDLAGSAASKAKKREALRVVGQAGDRNISRTWSLFAERLVANLAVLDEDQFLVVSDKRTKRFVQFAALGAHGMRAEAISNVYLKGEAQLDEGQVAAMIDAGWTAPTSDARSCTPLVDPDGSSNFFMDFSAPVPFELLTAETLKALNGVLGVRSPSSLQYDAFDLEGNVMLLPSLGLKRAPRALPVEPNAGEDLPQLLLAAMQRTTRIDGLSFDKDGDIGVGFGSRVAFARLVGKAPYVLFHSGILFHAEETPELHARINEMNTGSVLVHYFLHAGVVYAAAEIPARPFVSEQVENAWVEYCRIVGEIGQVLAAEFGEGMTAPGSMRSVLLH